MPTNLSTTTTTPIRRRPTRQKATPYHALSLLAEPHTLYLTIEGEIFLIQGRKHAYLNAATREILVAEHWIEEGIPIQITQGRMTQEGRDAAQHLEEMKRAYQQMDLWLPPDFTNDSPGKEK